MHAGNHQVLLLFKEGGSRTIQSPHDGNGNLLHLAFAIPAAESRVGKLGTSVEGLLAAVLMSVAGAAVRAQVKAKHPIQSTNGTASSKPPHR